MFHSEHSHCKTNLFSFLSPDEVWWLNFYDDQRSLTNIYKFLLELKNLLLLLFFSVMEMPLYFQPLSALFSSLSHFVLEK